MSLFICRMSLLSTVRGNISSRFSVVCGDIGLEVVACPDTVCVFGFLHRKTLRSVPTAIQIPSCQ